MMKTENSKIGNAVAALEPFAGGVGPVALIGLGLTAAVTIVSTAGF